MTPTYPARPPPTIEPMGIRDENQQVIFADPRDAEHVDACIWAEEHAFLAFPHRTLFFLDPFDVATKCLPRGFTTPCAVMSARIQGNSQDTYDISLVLAETHGQGPMLVGNAVYIAVALGHVFAKFAPTADALLSYHDHGHVEELRDIAMVNALPVNVEALPKLPPKTNTFLRASNANDPNDYTTFMSSQAGWCPSSPPPSARILEPLFDHGIQVSWLTDSQGRNVLGPTGRPLRDFDHILPRRISTTVPYHTGWLLGFWWMEDCRITTKDILDRMVTELDEEQRLRYHTHIQGEIQMWLQVSGVLGMAVPGGIPSRSDVTVVVRLPSESLRENTSWELDRNGRYVRLPGAEAVVWYLVPQKHDTAQQGQMSPRVAALFNSLGRV